MSRSTCQRRGFATILALLLLGLAAAAGAAISSALAAHVRLSRDRMADAQLRQLLLAGAQAARHELGAGGIESPQRLPLPPELSRDGADLTLTVLPAAGNTRPIRIEARIGARHLAQKVVFQAGTWQIMQATLEP